MSSGKEANVLFKAACISAAVPSKNLPQPSITELAPFLGSLYRLGVKPVLGLLTAMEQRISGEDYFLLSVLGEPADAVLRMARRVEALHGNAPNLKPLPIRRGLRDGIAVLAPDDREIRGPQIATLEDLVICLYQLLPPPPRAVAFSQSSCSPRHDPSDYIGRQYRTRRMRCGDDDPLVGVHDGFEIDLAS